ncbi:MAG: ABC transporter permease [Saezia sp.]
MDEFLVLLSSMMLAGTPLLIAGLGLLLNERVGVLNLGAEGMMLMGAMAGFAGALWTGSVLFGLFLGAVAAGLLAALFGVLVIFFMTNQYATGLAVMLFGTGLSAFLGTSLVQERLNIAQSGLIDNMANAAAIVLTAAIAYFFYRTRWGLVMRSVGESPESAHAIGYPVRLIRMLAVVAGGALCGVAGAFLSTISSPVWSEGMTAGKGWIALALIAFATWRPWRILFGAYLFGGVGILQLNMQAKGVYFVNSFVMSMLPYIATILVLVLISHQPGWIRANMPASLGKPFHPSH